VSCARNRDIDSVGIHECAQTVYLCHRQCSEPLDCNNCYAKLSAIEMKINEALSLRSAAKPGEWEPSPQQEVEDKEVYWVEDKRLYLPLQGKQGIPYIVVQGRQC
jgi:hypothetical protein